MDWSNLREWSERPIDLPFEFTVRIQIDAKSPQPADYLQILETAFFDGATRLSRRFLEGRDRIAAITGERSKLVPWLSGPAMGLSAPLAFQLGFFVTRFELRRPLPGQKFTKTALIAEFFFRDDESFPVRPIQFVIDSIELGEGSLLAKIKGVIRTPTLAALAFLAALTGTVEYAGDLAEKANAMVELYDKGVSWSERREFERKIDASTQHERCVVDLQWNADVRKVLDAGEEALNYDAPNLSPGERTARICNAQLVLNALVKSIPIDGIAGPQTKQAIREFAEYVQLPAGTTITDKLLRRKLLQEFISLTKGNTA